LLLHGVNYTSGKFATGVNDTNTLQQILVLALDFLLLEHL
jgi:hypothetical protein